MEQWIRIETETDPNYMETNMVEGAFQSSEK